LNLKIDTEVLRSYLLGTLEAEPRVELEEKILSDPGVYDEVLLLEDELIDQYVAGGLSKAERQQFETHFLITAERQKKLRFGQLLKSHLSSQTIPAFSEKVPAPQHNQTIPSRRFFSLFAFTAVIVTALGIALLCWFVFRKPVVVVQLAPGSVEKRGVTVPPQGFNVKLELAVANTNFKNYKSELFRENTPVQTNALKIEKKGEQQIVPLTITGETLSPGDYQVKLSGVSDTGQDEFIDNYTFRVTTK
jgi:anti-sigma-K factor RskA